MRVHGTAVLNDFQSPRRAASAAADHADGYVGAQVNHLYFTLPTGVRDAILGNDFMNRCFWNQEWRDTKNSGNTGLSGWRFGYGVGQHTYFEMPSAGELGFAQDATGLSISVASHAAGQNLAQALSKSFAASDTTEAKLSVSEAPGEPQTHVFQPFQRDFYEFGVDKDAQGRPAFAQRVEMWAQEERRLDGKPGVPSRAEILKPHYDPHKMFRDFESITMAVSPTDMPTVDAMLTDAGFQRDAHAVYHPQGRGTDIELVPGSDTFQGLVRWTATLNQQAVHAWLAEHPDETRFDFGGGVSLSLNEAHGRYVAQFTAQP